MSTSRIFAEPFYTDIFGDSYDLAPAGSIDKRTSPQKTFFQKCKLFVLGTWVDEKTLALASRINDIIGKVRENDWNEFRKEIHDHGAQGFAIFWVTFSHLLDSCERKNPSLLVICALRIYSFVRTFFKYAPIEIPRIPKFFKSKRKMQEFLSRLKHEALQLTQEEKKNCHFALEIIKGNSGKLTVENVQKLEYGLRRSISVDLVGGIRQFFIDYSKENKTFSCGVISTRSGEIPMYPQKKEITTLAQMSLKEDEQQYLLQHKVAIEPKKNGADYQPVFTKHELKLDSVYTILTNIGDLQFRLVNVR